MKRPDFFVLGAARSGTTSLWAYLLQHPQIFLPPDELHKEPSFFCPRRGMSDPAAYSSLFASARPRHKRIGEASTAYLTCGASAGLLHSYQRRLNKDIRLIIILRNPAARAYSLYNWMTQEGYEYCPTFRTALGMEQWRQKKRIPNFIEIEYYHNYLYFSSGLYHGQVKRYLDLFSRSQVHILLFERFITAPLDHLSAVFKFLGVDPAFTPSTPVRNPSRKRVSPMLQYALRRSNRFFGSGKNTKKKRDALLRAGLRKGSPAPLSLELRNRLMKKYLPDIKKLEQLLNQDFSIWYDDLE